MARVLVVDDDADIRGLVRLTLELDGHEITEAADGMDALQAFETQSFDLVVLDVTMPRLGGWDVLVTMKAGDPAVAGVPVILVTALSTDLDQIRGGIEGAVHYLTKPFAPEALRAEARRALEVPEPVQRRRAQQRAMERLAVLEKHGPGGSATTGARPRLTRLGPPVEAPATAPRARRLRPEQVRALSPRQLELLQAVAATPTVLAAAEQLHVSRSNVYASLRRIARRVGVASVTELVALAREGVDGDDG